MAKRSNRIRGYSAIADFLDKYVKNAAANPEQHGQSQ